MTCKAFNPVELLWGAMHGHVTPNKCYAAFARSRTASLAVLTQEVPKNGPSLREAVTGNFRVIGAKDIRVLT
ncbi:MAG: hypothetical protein M3Z96_08720 [Pseudomonadota bacterium]|nr:hypothetical protein [Pseudomonadota bacterium]